MHIITDKFVEYYVLQLKLTIVRKFAVQQYVNNLLGVVYSPFARNRHLWMKARPDMQEWCHSSTCRISVCISVWMTPDIRMNCRFILSRKRNRWERYGLGRQIIKYLFSENTYTHGGLFLLFCAIFACMASLSTRRHLTVQGANTWLFWEEPVLLMTNNVYNSYWYSTVLPQCKASNRTKLSIVSQSRLVSK